MTSMLSLRAGLVSSLIGLTACGGDKLIVPAPLNAPFKTVAEADPGLALQLFGGGGQWTIDVTATIHNRAGEPRIFTYATLCPVPLEVYSQPSPSGTPAWSTLGRPLGCKSPVDTVVLAPGDSLVLHGTHTTTNEILAHYDIAPPNPPGQYFFFAFINTSLWPADSTRRLVGFSQLGP